MKDSINLRESFQIPLRGGGSSRADHYACLQPSKQGGTSLVGAPAFLKTVFLPLPALIFSTHKPIISLGAKQI